MSVCMPVGFPASNFSGSVFGIKRWIGCSDRECWSPVYAGYQLVGIDWNVDQVTEHWQRLPGQGRGGGPPGGDADGRGGGPGDGDDGRGGGPPDPGQGPSKKKPATDGRTT